MKNLFSLFFISVILFSFNTTSISARAVDFNFGFNLPSIKKLINDDIEQLLKEANELFQQKKYDEALIILKKAAELSPKDFRPIAVAGIIYLAQFKLENASEEFNKAIALNPNNKYLYLYKARANYYQNKREESLAAAQKALEIDPLFVDAHIITGDILRYMKGRENEAVEAYQKAIKINPKVFSAYVNLADTLKSAKKEKEAEEAYTTALSLDPDKTAGRFALGRLLVKQGRLKEARKLWEERTSDKDNTFPNFIVVLERAENLKAAEDALAKNPNDPKTILQMGNAVMDGDSWVVDGRQERAITYFRKALELKPDFIEAQYAIVKAYIQIADTFKKEDANVDKELIKLRELDPKLAKEMEEYRKNYSGGLKTGPPPPKQ